MESSFSLAELSSRITGTTLKVYIHLVRNNKETIGVRELFRELDFSSVSVAAYHLKKLEEFELVTKNAQNRYAIKMYFALGELENYFRLKGRFIPREAFFVSFYISSLLIGLLSLLFQIFPVFVVISLMILVVSSVRSSYHLYSFWQHRDDPDT